MADIMLPVGAVAAALSAAIVLAWLRPATIVEHPRTVLALAIAVSLAAAAALVDIHPLGVGIRLDSSEEPMLRHADPAREIYREAIDSFGDDDVYVVAMETDDVFTSAHLRALRRVSDRIRRLPGVRAVESLVDTTTYRYVPETDAVEVGAFIDDIPQDGAALADLRRRALADRLYPRTLISTDGRTAAVNVSFRTMSDGEFVARRLDERIRAILDDETGDGRRFFVTGRQHIKARAHRLMVRDLLRLIPLAVVVGASIGWIGAGRLRAAVIPVGSSLVATLWIFGALAALGRPLNLITLILGPMLICVGNPYGVHVLTHYDELAADSRRPPDAALDCLRYTTLPVLISSATTVIGFSALYLSPQEAVREFAVFSVLGIAAITLLTLTALPALFALLPAPAAGALPVARLSAAVASGTDALLSRIAALATRRPALVIGAWSLAALTALALIPRTVIDTDYLTFFDPDSEVRRDFAAVSGRLVGAVPIYVTVRGHAEGAFREPANLHAIERLQARIGAIPAVDATLSVVDLIAVLNRALEKNDPAAERVPDTRAQAAELLFLVPKNKLRRFANSDHSKANLLVRTGESGSAAVRDLERRLDDAIAAADLPADLDVEITGNTIVLNRAVDLIAGNQIGSVTLTAATILVIVSSAFRSLRIGLLAMVPNLIPVCIFFGLLGAGAAPLSLPTSLIACVALGITIDDTAHYLVAYRYKRACGETPVQAATATTAFLGRPIVVTAFMEIGGLCVLCLSGFATLREFGYLASSTMLICLATDLLMTPALLVRGRV
jgi:predicted RND superfamily exporter protein